MEVEVRNKEEEFSSPEDREENSSAIPFAEFFSSAKWPVNVSGLGLVGPNQVLIWAAKCGLDLSTGVHKASMEQGGAILYRPEGASPDSEPIAAYWD